ncbi:MAG: cobalt-precorrin-5B (C(1))-methyltransferase CbiD [Lachnospiraceae bacterium]|nr:cobalt-precorrin-5B (C(1))-methyltransferase CbiD [Lachnospiraceae bacterium]
MEKGFTTGSCAAAAGKAAAWMLLSGNEKTQIRIETPAGESYTPKIEEITIGENYVRCAVRKQSGDDPDITNGILVFARVSFHEDHHSNEIQSAATDEGKLNTDHQLSEEAGTKEEETQLHEPERKVIIIAGEGVGKVTRPGLDQPVGEAAINSVPRQMIEEEVGAVMDLFDLKTSLIVEISVPGGEKLADKTFNPRLGIEGGISIIGTTGIVEPMSTKALLDTIRVELRQHRAMGEETVVVSPGNYGLNFMKDQYGYDLDRAVKCSNYIGDTIDMAQELGFRRLLLCGHIGKLIKVSGGIMNTHSAEADCRMELMVAAAIRSGASEKALTAILDCATTEEAIEIFRNEKIEKACFSYICERAGFYLQKRAAGQMETECMIYSNKYGLLGKTGKAEELLKQARAV